MGAQNVVSSVEARLRAAVESSPSGLLMIDAEGRIVLVNHEIERLFGYAREELLGQPMDKLVPPRFRAHHPHHRSAFHAKPSVRAMGAGRDLFGVRKDGVEVPVEIGLTPVATEEGMFVLSSIVDITARRNAEADRRRLEARLRQSHKMEAVGTLARGVAHSFNNLLSEIVGYAEMIDHEVADAGVRQDLAALLNAADRGSQMVRRILAFARTEESERRVIDLGGCVNEGVKLMRAAIPSSVDIHLRCGSRLPRVQVSENAVHQALMHLGTNAADAMAHDGVLDVSVDLVRNEADQGSASPELHAGDWVVLTVTDTGRGMNESTRERAFEPFFTTKAPGRGTGLGLSVVHAIMEEHGGHVLLESRPGEGTTVRCCFPPHDLPTLSTPNDTDVPRGAGERILLVDDEPALVAITKRRLERIGYQVTGDASALSAFERLRSTPDAFDLLLTDYTMPGMNGLELAKAAAGVRASMPVILVSGNRSWSSDEESAHANLRRILEKPLTIREFGVALREVLDSAA